MMMIKSAKEEVLALRTEYREMQATQIAKEIGVSKERVRQILIELGLPTKIHKRKPGHNFCPCCGNKYD